MRKITWSLYYVTYDGFPLGGKAVVIAKSISHAYEVIRKHTDKRSVDVEKLCDLGEMADLHKKAFFKELEDGDY